MGKASILSPVTVLLLVHSCIAWLVSSSSSNTTDQSALLAFKARITLDPDNTLATNWTIGSSFCNWIGVRCSSRRQRVTSLVLSNMGLKGTIEPQLSNLSFLQVLDLSNNSFHGQLPYGLGHLHRLKYLHLEYNQFTGNVPRELGMLSKLLWLSLHNNSLSGAIPPSIGNISMLAALELSSDNLAGPIPKELGNLVNLQLLSLEHNQLTGVIPSTIFNISVLRYLLLQDNSISGSLPMDIGRQLPELQWLLLFKNQFSGYIPSSLCQCGKLLKISLGRNNFIGGLPREIGNLSNLVGLYVHHNALTGTIPPSISNLSNLLELDMGNNNFVGVIPKEIGHLENLQFMSFQDNNLKGSVPEEIFNISTLGVMALTDNSFSGNLPAGIGNWLPRITILYLGNNHFSGKFPASISNASQLTSLELANNSFSGPIPTSIGNLRNLQILNLAGNLLEDQPNTQEIVFLTSLTNCRFLEQIEIDSNPLNGFLPDSIGNLSTSLTIFTGASCQIRGNIPKGLGNLSNIITLNLGSNELSGTIPSTIGGLGKLQRLYLGHNKIHGSIGNDLCSLNQLGELYLHGNNLSGQLPNCIGNLSRLEVLDLSSNILTSHIPLSLWSLSDLLTLNLSHNSLYDNLPQEVGDMDFLELLDMSWNHLSGNISSTIGGLQRLKYLILSRNSLQGSLPQSFGNLLSLISMDLSFNNLSGNIPKSLEKLPFLSFLNLSYNKFEGEIPSRGPFVNFTAQSFMGNEALCGLSKLKVPPCPPKATKSRTKFLQLKYILPTCISIVILAVLISLLVLRYRLKGKHAPVQVNSLTEVNYRMITYQELLRGTNNFHNANLLGVGSFSSVYKATLSDGMVVAVKVFDSHLEGAFKSFDAECQVMRSVRHRNLVKIISSCSNLDFRSLIMQFMPNGSLETWIHSQNYFLSLLQRINIMIDVASALEYLHYCYSEPIVHCDLKPSNVLLDEDMVAHVSDFGITKILAEKKNATQTKTLGTIGYIAPEYGSEGRVSRSCDVYSYGIMLMEIFTRKKPTDEMFVGELNLRTWVNASLPNAVMKIVDEILLSEDESDLNLKQQVLFSIMELALDCTMESADERLNINEVNVRLRKIRKQLESRSS